MGPKNGQMEYSMPEELLKHMSSEMSSERVIANDFIVYVSKVGQTESNKIYDMLKAGYAKMARINLNMCEMDLENDVFCLEDYEDILRDESDGC